MARNEIHWVSATKHVNLNPNNVIQVDKHHTDSHRMLSRSSYQFLG